VRHACPALITQHEELGDIEIVRARAKPRTIVASAKPPERGTRADREREAAVGLGSIATRAQITEATRVICGDQTLRSDRGMNNSSGLLSRVFSPLEARSSRIGIAAPFVGVGSLADPRTRHISWTVKRPA
jgi:hypothetical protein